MRQKKKKKNRKDWCAHFTPKQPGWQRCLPCLTRNAMTGTAWAQAAMSSHLASEPAA